MEDNSLLQDIVFKREVEPCTQICRCCLSTDKQMKNVLDFRNCFEELAGITVSESDGLPQWLCEECCALITKAARIRWKILKAHGLLYEYSSRCAPFPIDAQDVELTRYASPNLHRTPTLILDFTVSIMGFSKAVQHEKRNEGEFLELDLPSTEEPQEAVKEEGGFSDYEDNITLEEYRSTVNKSPQRDSAESFDRAEIEKDTVEVSGNKKRKVKKSEKKPRKKKKNGEEDASEETPTKSYIRKTIEIDPAKIRIVTLNPEEQIKQREEESKAGLKFPYQCNLCYKGFNFEAKLQNHMYKHSPARGTYKCKLCTMYLPTMYSYSVHSLIHTRRYECVQCGRRMIDRQSIIDHYRTEHEGLLSVYTCHLCGKVSNNNKTHRGHMRNHHSGERPKCDQCGKTFVNNDSLAQHLQIHEGIKNYECPECNKKFRTRTQLKHHQLKHTDVKDYYCVECDVRFKSQHNLRQHLKKNLKHKDKQSFKYLCTRCPKRFENSAALSAHVAVQHEGVRAHACPQCPAALATRSSLAKHVRAVHKGARAPPRHVCDTCGKAFRGKSVLTNHVRTHTGEKPYECWECGRKFTQRTAMRTHVKLVHLKIRRTAKIKPEMAAEEPKMESIFKEEAPLVYEGWNKNQLQPCDIYFTVATALAP